MNTENPLFEIPYLSHIFCFQKRKLFFYFLYHQINSKSHDVVGIKWGDIKKIPTNEYLPRKEVPNGIFILAQKQKALQLKCENKGKKWI